MTIRGQSIDIAVNSIGGNEMNRRRLGPGARVVAAELGTQHDFPGCKGGTSTEQVDTKDVLDLVGNEYLGKSSEVTFMDLVLLDIIG